MWLRSQSSRRGRSSVSLRSAGGWTFESWTGKPRGSLSRGALLAGTALGCELETFEVVRAGHFSDARGVVGEHQVQVEFAGPGAAVLNVTAPALSKFNAPTVVTTSATRRTVGSEMQLGMGTSEPGGRMDDGDASAAAATADAQVAKKAPGFTMIVKKRGPGAGVVVASEVASAAVPVESVPHQVNASTTAVAASTAAAAASSTKVTVIDTKGAAKAQQLGAGIARFASAASSAAAASKPNPYAVDFKVVSARSVVKAVIDKVERRTLDAGARHKLEKQESKKRRRDLAFGRGGGSDDSEDDGDSEDSGAGADAEAEAARPAKKRKVIFSVHGGVALGGAAAAAPSTETAVAVAVPVKPVVEPRPSLVSEAKASVRPAPARAPTDASRRTSCRRRPGSAPTGRRPGRTTPPSTAGKPERRGSSWRFSPVRVDMGKAAGVEGNVLATPQPSTEVF